LELAWGQPAAERLGHALGTGSLRRRGTIGHGARKARSRCGLHHAVDIDQYLAFPDMRMEGGFVKRQYRRHAYVLLAKQIAPLLLGTGLEPSRQNGLRTRPSAGIVLKTDLLVVHIDQFEQSVMELLFDCRHGYPFSIRAFIDFVEVSAGIEQIIPAGAAPESCGMQAEQRSCKRCGAIYDGRIDNLAYA